ncbi:MAG: DUF835 domain-containing protein [Candidatus Woesearchaeota archaeon]
MNEIKAQDELSCPELIENIRFNKKINYGKSYISLDYHSDNAQNIFINKVNSGQKGILVTRNNPENIIKQTIKDLFVILLNNQALSNYKTTNKLKELEDEIRKFITNNEKSIMYLDRIDYLITLYGFNKFLNFIYNINDMIIKNNSLLIIHAHPEILNKQETGLLLQELNELPKPEIYNKVILAQDLYEILELIASSDTKVTFKTVCKKFSITKTTARKRINNLFNKKLITVKKDGRSKVLELTKEGKSIL